MRRLPADDYQIVIPRLKEVAINNLFARSVVERHVKGKVYVDNTADPRAFHVVHPYGMSLLFGDVSEGFLRFEFADYLLGRHGLRKAEEWLQVFPSVLENRIDKILIKKKMIVDRDQSRNPPGGAVVKDQRVNFRFNLNRFKQFRYKCDLSKYSFSNVDKALYNETNGMVVPNKFWNNASEFALHGVGFALMMKDKAVAIAFSAYAHDDMLELGMETKSEYRRKGFASVVSAKLIDHCMERGLEPVWACRRGNPGSYNLAIKLGFEPVAWLPYYGLS